MTGHTKEPWEVDGEYCQFVIGQNDKTVADCSLFDDDELERANARRIIDCVNPLAGIPDPAAYVAAFDGMVGLLARVPDETILDADLSDDIHTALTAARLARGGEA